MKTPKEKAVELVNNFMSEVKMPQPIFGLTTSEAKQCAIIAVDEILSERFDFREQATPYNNQRIKYWQEVKTEINNL